MKDGARRRKTIPCFIQYYTRTTLDSRAVARLFYTSTSAQRAARGGTKMEWKNNNPGRLSGAPLRPSREKTQSAKTAPSPAPAARARARGPPLFV
jgi:hypothetical protein